MRGLSMFFKGPVVIHRGPSPEATADLLASWLHDVVQKSRPPVHIALSGGRTPRILYKLLVRGYRHLIPWENLHIWQVDERWVPPDDPQANQRMIRETLLEPLHFPQEHIHFIDLHQPGPEEAARLYARDIHASGLDKPESPSFEITLLGIGTDGHTASLFPHSSSLDETEHMVTVTHTPSSITPPIRITLTLPAINRSRDIVFFVTGSEKKEIITRLFSLDKPNREIPASLVKPLDSLHFFIDDEAMPFHPTIPF